MVVERDHTIFLYNLGSSERARSLTVVTACSCAQTLSSLKTLQPSPSLFSSSSSPGRQAKILRSRQGLLCVQSRILSTGGTRESVRRCEMGEAARG